MLSFNSKKQLLQFLAEDIGKGDITSSLLSKRKISVRIISRENGIIAGTTYSKEIFKLEECSTKILKKDGSRIKPNQTVMTITGDAEKILMCERTVLNLLTR
ncbi:MAG: nicotinate-nucleotide diphosphorylase (carboxylating), partial [Thaumarchaeota archaeon]|nr:nicotinate-nucleotide diphosphorylase (carboxylating) [Nitrososphaerota archaeon]